MPEPNSLNPVEQTIAPEVQATDTTTDKKAPLWVILVSLVLLITLVIILLNTTVTLIDIGEGLIEVSALVVASTASLIPLITYFLNSTRQLIKVPSIPSWVIPLTLEATALVIVIIVRAALFQSFAEQQLDAAKQAETIGQTQEYLQNAKSLGASVEGWLSGVLSNSIADNQPEQVILLAPLFADYSALSQMTPEVESALNEAIMDRNSQLAADWATILASMSPAGMNNTAGAFNDAGLQAIVDSRFKLAQSFLEAVRSIDELIERDSMAESVARYNLGLAYEFDLSLEGHIERALHAYEEAIELDENNLDARYGFGVQTLITFPDDEDRLRRAVGIVQQGERKLPDDCENDILLPTSTESREDKMWCFLLLTTEAGLRWKLGENVESLLQGAIQLAKSNDHFGDDLFTAEAYYYLAQVGAQPPEKETLCTILADFDQHSMTDRQETWAEYAEQQLQLHYETGCFNTSP